MIIGFTGYHSTGKSVLTDFLSKEFGWRKVNKRTLFREWSGVKLEGEEWVTWYRDMYRKRGSYQITKELLKFSHDIWNPGSIVLLDAIHTPDEWKAVLELNHTALLVGVFVPRSYRQERSSPEDLRLDERRERFWHNEGDHKCLLSEIEWAFSGCPDDELRYAEATAFQNYLVSSGRIN